MTFYTSIATPFPALKKKILAQFLEKTRTLRNLRQQFFPQAVLHN